MNTIRAAIVAVALVVAGCSGATETTSAPAADVRLAYVDGNPPFTVDTTPIEPADEDGVWAHQLGIASQSDVPIAIATDDITIDLTGETANDGKLVPDEIATLEPGDVQTITVHLPTEGGRPRSGVHHRKILIPFWRDIEAIEPELPAGVASVALEYQPS